ncbi:Phosphoserine phosphatase RsbP [Planctomycetes bacterium CA13]|uniref:Phosphoserine phosphatase RsbP n=1 Tax=Novipirellula herctigrandis TaxID=2527986 RepID=A0A5C5Z6X2_9BACT|nr:Phosphoserine phosphatase RsbP [Planctomycetes bacterium CA13]
MNEHRSPLILMIEDNLDDVEAVRRWLSRSETTYDFVGVRTINEAGQLIRERLPDLILLDLTLTESFGLDSLRQVQCITEVTPIVIFTGISDRSMAIRAVRSGVEDYILKSEVTRPEHLSRPIDLAIERNRRKSAEVSLLAVESQMDLARRIQCMLLPKPDESFANVQWRGRCEPADQAGGDFYDLMEIPNGGLAFVIADVSGHGLGPAMLMMETRAILRAMATVCHDPGTILTRANRIIYHDVQMKYFVTLFLGCLSVDRRTICYASAGHPGYLLGDNQAPISLESLDPPLGIVADKVYTTVQSPVSFESRTLLLFTDGIVDSISAEPTQQSFQFAVDQVSRHASEPIAKLIDFLFANVDLDDLERDDCTALLLRSTKSLASSASPRVRSVGLSN